MTLDPRSPHAPLALPCGVFTNCSFETGTLSGWTSIDLAIPYFPAQVVPPGIGSGAGAPSTPTDGGFSYVNGFDGGGPGVISLAQDVILSPDAAALTFSMRAAWYNYGALARTFSVDIEPSGGGAPLASTLVLSAAGGTTNPDTGPLTGIVPVAAFAGQSVRVVFRWLVPEYFTGPAFLDLDRIQVSESICGPVANCSFETGSASSWALTEFPAPYFPSFVTGAGTSVGFGLFTSAPTDGALALVHSFDATVPGDMFLMQDVTLPSGALSVEFDYRAGWDMVTYGGSTQPRSFEFGLEPAGGGSLLIGETVLIAPPATKVLDTGPVTRSVDVSAFAGQDVRLVFRWRVPQAFTGPGLFQLDHVALNSSLLGAPSPGQPEHTLTLLPAAPNPARTATTFRVSLQVTGDVELEIVDVHGGRVWYEHRSAMPAGEHALTWDGRRADGRAAPAGVYFAHVRTGDAASSRMFVRVK